ncbi:hypothetical protein C9374_009891 [Naegleria lovaniensis]|uniref:Uncharacterized protein n=1 Tax=Naegleria lovaniensis TaxID=51637 RepID=A0AA88GI13_NAELO|nr:uncharacterized protein C9374_009891 [Naegleria lovaniensis]KAG2375268.1 hypothetical protein C9374_009891 [Naegleria lovaniensis]
MKMLKDQIQGLFLLKELNKQGFLDDKEYEQQKKSLVEEILVPINEKKEQAVDDDHSVPDQYRKLLDEQSASFQQALIEIQQEFVQLRTKDWKRLQGQLKEQLMYMEERQNQLIAKSIKDRPLPPSEEKLHQTNTQTESMDEMKIELLSKFEHIDEKIRDYIESTREYIDMSVKVVKQDLMEHKQQQNEVKQEILGLLSKKIDLSVSSLTSLNERAFSEIEVQKKDLGLTIETLDAMQKELSTMPNSIRRDIHEYLNITFKEDVLKAISKGDEFVLQSVSDIARQYTDIKVDGLEHAIENIAELLRDEVENLKVELDQSNDNSSKSIASLREEMSNSLKLIKQEVDEKVNILEQSLSRSEAAMSSEITNLKSKLESNTLTIMNTIDTMRISLNENLERAFAKLENKILERNEEHNERLKETKLELETRMNNFKKDSDTQVALLLSHVDRLDKRIDTSELELKNRVEKAQDMFTENLQQVNELLKKAMEERFDNILQFSKDQIDQILSRMNSELDTVKNNQQHMEASFKQSLESNVSTLTGLIDSSFCKINQTKNDLEHQSHNFSSLVKDLEQKVQDTVAQNQLENNEKFIDIKNELKGKVDILTGSLDEARKSFESKTNDLNCDIQSSIELMTSKIESVKVASLEIIEQKSKNLEETIAQTGENLGICSDKLQKLKKQFKERQYQLQELVSDLKKKAENHNLENQGMKISLAKLEENAERSNNTWRTDIDRIDASLEKIGVDIKSLTEYTKTRVKRFKSTFEAIRSDNAQKDQATSQKLEEIFSITSQLATKQELSSSESLYSKELRTIDEKLTQKLDTTEQLVSNTKNTLQNKIEEIQSTLSTRIERNTTQIMDQVVKYEADLKDKITTENEKLCSNLKLDVQEKITSVQEKMSAEATNFKIDIQNLETRLKNELIHLESKQKHDIQNHDTKQKQEIQNLETNFKLELKTHEAKQMNELKSMENKIYEKIDVSETDIKGFLLSAKQNVEEISAFLRNEMDRNTQSLKNELTLHDTKVKIQIKSEVDSFEKALKILQEENFKEILDKTGHEHSKLRHDLQVVESKSLQELQALEIRFKQELMSLRDKQTEDIISLDSRYKQEISLVSQSLSSEIQSIETKCAEKIADGEQRISKMEEKHEQITADVNSKINSEIETLSKRSEDELLKMEIKFKGMLKETETNARAMKVEMHDNISTVSEKIRSEITSELVSFKEKHQQESQTLVSKQKQDMESFDLRIKHDLKLLQDSHEKEMQYIETRHAQALNSMEAILNQRLETTSKSVTEISNSLQKEAVKHEQLLNTEQKLESHLNVLRSDFEQIRNSAHHQFGVLNEKIENILRCESKQEQLNKDLVLRTELLQVQQQVDSTLDLLNKGIDTVAKSLNDLKVKIGSVEETSSSNLHKITQHHSSIEELLLQDRTLQERLNDVDQRLSDEIDSMKATTKESLTDVEETMVKNITRFETQIGEQISKIQSSIENIKVQSVQDVQQVDEKLMGLLQQECSKLAAKDIELQNRLETVHHSLQSENEISNKSIHTLRNKVDATISEIDNLVKLQQDFKNEYRSVLTNVENAITEIRSALKENEKEDEETKRMFTSFKDAQLVVNSTHESKISSIQGFIEERHIQMGDKLESFKEELRDQVREIAVSLPILTTAVEKLEANHNELSTTSLQNTQSLQNMIDEQKNNMHQALKSLSEVVELENKNNTDALSALRKCNERLETNFVRAEEDIEQKLSKMKDMISQSVDSFKELVAQLEEKSATSNEVHQLINNIEVKMAESKESLLSQQRDSVVELQTKISDIKEIVSRHVDSSILQLQGLDQKTSDKLDMLKNESKELLNNVENRINDIIHNDTEKYETLLSTCSLLSRQFEDLRSHLNTLQNLFENTRSEMFENEKRADNYCKLTQEQFVSVNKDIQDLLLNVKTNSDLICKEITVIKEEVELSNIASQEVSKSTLEKLSKCFTKLNNLNDLYCLLKEDVNGQIESLMNLVEESERKKIEKLQSVLLSSSNTNSSDTQ